jgi:hypothetical protein
MLEGLVKETKSKKFGVWKNILQIVVCRALLQAT